MFGSITDEEIAANAGKTYQDATALRDPLMGLGYGEEAAPFEGAAQDAALDYSPDQPRDKYGQWTGGGLTGGEESDKMKSSLKISATGANHFERGFTEKNLTRHMKKHGAQDYPGMTAEEYNQRALELVQSPVSKDVLGYKTADGGVVRYRISTNEFVKGYPDGGIATMYKPKGDPLKGLKYYQNQEKKEGILDD